MPNEASAKLDSVHDIRNAQMGLQVRDICSTPYVYELRRKVITRLLELCILCFSDYLPFYIVNRLGFSISHPPSFSLICRLLN